jgi:hypothetical protein
MSLYIFFFFQVIWESFSGRSRKILALGLKQLTGELPSTEEIEIFLTELSENLDQIGTETLILEMLLDLLKLEGLSPTRRNVKQFLQFCKVDY